MSFFENAWYYVFNVLTFGALFTAKVIYKKALIEAKQSK